MKRYYLFLSAIALSGASLAQDFLTFDSLGLPLDTFWNGSMLDTPYVEGSFEVPCEFDTAFGGYWASGIAISTMRDTVTGDYTNLYSAIPGTGHESAAYGLVNAASSAIIKTNLVDNWAYAPRWMKFYITNSTYAFRSMQNGDLFAKKFGGNSGNDPDYLFVRMTFEYEPHLDFYLADFRDSNNAEDYIINDWVLVDLNDYPNLESVGSWMKFDLFSSDTGAFGINTPAFFCIDDVEYDIPGAVSDGPDASRFEVSVRPNSFVVEAKLPADFSLTDLHGRVIRSSQSALHFQPETDLLPKGIYIIKATDIQGQWSQKVYRW